jgi:proline-specific peptidase
MTIDTTEGLVAVPGGNVWYKRLDPGTGIPLLTLHGGPGCGHDYLEPLEALASDRPVVFFDQLGCGRSDKPQDDSLWNIERFVEEVDAVRNQLSLDTIHVLGHSWGGWLAIEYMINEPSGIEGLILASTSASLKQVAEETARLKETLPAEVRQTLARHEEAGEFHHPDYEAAMMEFYRRFVCRLDPWPDALMRTLANMEEYPLPYETMQGPNEFTITGNLKTWNREGALREIRNPALVTCGRFDELGPPCAQTLLNLLPNAELQIFEQSAHCAHLEESERYLSTLRQFLDRVEAHD